MSACTLQLLGLPQFTRDGAPVALTQAKAIAVLLYLGVTGSPQRRERLVDMLWPESLPQAARKNMRNTLWAIGEALGPDVVQQEGGALRLSPNVAVDVRSLEDGALLLQSGDNTGLERAAAQYRGALAEGLALHEAPEFEIWLQSERERLAELTLRLLGGLIAHNQQAGRWDDVISAAQRALAIDPLREPVHLALIEAHIRLGQRGQAAQQYAALTDNLRRELDVPPLPETSARYAALLGDAATPRLARPAYSRGPSPEAAPPPAPPFIGRADELAALDAEYTRAARGEARVALITGDLGMGKSALWRAWVASRAPGAVVLATEALETSEPLPFSPLLTLLRQDGPARDLMAPPSPLAPVWLAELTRLLPEIAAAWPALPPPLALPPAEERARLFQALAEALRLLADPLLALVLDDLHWADPSTLDWLAYLLSQLRRAPLLLIATARPQEAPDRLTALVGGWQRQGVVRQIALPPLSAAEGTALLAALDAAGDAASRAALAHQSGGNPFFLTELSRAGAPDAANDLAALVRGRLQTTLSPMATQVLQAAAVLGADLTFGMLQAASGRSEEETLDAADALLRAGVLAEHDGGYRFVHPLVANVVAGDLSQTRRQFLHRRVAHAIERAHPERESVAGRLSAHYSGAGDLGQAAQYAELAARHAQSLTAWQEAGAYARQALDWAPTPGRALLLGELLDLGDADDAAGYLELARERFAREGDAPGEARACLRLALVAFGRGQPAEARVWLDRAPVAAAQQEAPGLGVEAHMLAAALERQRGNVAEAERLLQHAVGIAQAFQQPHLAAMPAFERGNLLADNGDLEGARAAFEEALAGARATGNLVLEMMVLNNLAFRAIRAGELDAAERRLAQAQEHADRTALGFVRQYLWSTAGELALARGLLDEADAAFVRASEAAEALGNQVHQANVRVNQSDIALARGDRDRARALVVEAVDLFGRSSDPFLRAKIRRAADALGVASPAALSDAAPGAGAVEQWRDG